MVLTGGTGVIGEKGHFVHQRSNLAARNSYIVYNNSVNLQQNGYRLSIPEIKLTVRGVDYARPSSVDVEERVEIRFFSPTGPSWRVIGRTLPFTFTLNNSVTTLQSTVCNSLQTIQIDDAVFSFENRMTNVSTLYGQKTEPSKTSRQLIQVLIAVT